MVFRRRFRRRRPYYARRRRYGGVGAPLGRPPRRTFKNRQQQNITRLVVYLKNVQAVTTNLQGEINWAINANTVAVTGDFAIYGKLYNEYKILKISVKMIPANVGHESTVIQVPPVTGTLIPNFYRGNAVTWVETDVASPTPTPGSIIDVINKSSARLIQPRRTHFRWIDRPKGYPEWGKLDLNGGVTTADKWVTQLRLFGENFAPIQLPGSQNYFYNMITFKVLFRSRQE